MNRLTALVAVFSSMTIATCVIMIGSVSEELKIRLAIDNSDLGTLVLLFSLPLAAIGSFLLLSLSGESLLNANTLMGFMILLGVVFKQVVFVDVAIVYALLLEGEDA